jgi:N-acetylneuraminic acid mutarotase
MLLISSALTVAGIAVVLFLLVIVFEFPSPMAQITTSTNSTTESFWTAGVPMPTPRTEVTAAVLEDDIYVIGGFDEFGQVTDIVEVYNIANNTWGNAAAPLPEPLHHTAASSYNGKIYVAGGYTAPWSPSNKLFIYDPVQNSWEEVRPMPTARGALNVNFVNGILYAIGGSSDRH